MLKIPEPVSRGLFLAVFGVAAYLAVIAPQPKSFTVEKRDWAQYAVKDGDALLALFFGSKARDRATDFATQGR